MAVRRPATQHNSKNSHSADTNDKKNSDVDVFRDLERRPDGQASHGQQRCSNGQHRREPKDQFVRVVRDDVFLDQQFHGVGNRLQQAVRPHAHGPEPRLHIRH